jgi:hypothetical protein
LDHLDRDARAGRLIIAGVDAAHPSFADQPVHDEAFGEHGPAREPSILFASCGKPFKRQRQLLGSLADLSLKLGVELLDLVGAARDLADLARDAVLELLVERRQLKLAALPNLKKLYATETKVTPEAAESFRRQKPNTFFSWARRPPAREIPKVENAKDPEAGAAQ